LTEDEAKRQKTIAFIVVGETSATLLSIFISWLVIGDPSSECEIPRLLTNQTEYFPQNNNFSVENNTFKNFQNDLFFFSSNISHRYLMSAAIHLTIFVFAFTMFALFIKEKKGSGRECVQVNI
jgi:hypothetical protein